MRRGWWEARSWQRPSGGTMCVLSVWDGARPSFPLVPAWKCWSASRSIGRSSSRRPKRTCWSVRWGPPSRRRVAKRLSGRSITTLSASAPKRPYLSVKGETEDALGKLGFRRLDILRPGLLRGHRQERRPLERLAQIFAPILDFLVLHGKYRCYRSISAAKVAQAIMALSHEKARGRFVHDYDAMLRAVRRGGD